MPISRRHGSLWVIDARKFEFLALGAALLIQSSAIFPLIEMGSTNELSLQAQARLRMLALPVYLVAAIILLRHSGQFIIAVRRSLPLVALSLLPFVSVLWSVAPSMTLRRAIALGLSLLFAYALAIRTTPAQLLRILLFMLGSLMGASLLLMVVAPHVALMGEDGSLRGVFPHKNVLGWMSALSVTVSGLVLYLRLEGLARVGAASLVVSFACLLLSQSVTSLMSVVTAGAFLGFFETLRRWSGLRRFMFILLSIELGALLIIGLSSYLPVILDALGKDPTFTGRVPLWELVDQRIALRPLLGYGYQVFWSSANGEAWAIWVEIQWMAPHAHNGYRDLLLSFGLLGTLPIIVFLAVTVRDGVRLHCRSADAIWLWPNIIICQILVINMTESNLFMPNDMQWTLVTVALIWIATRTREAAVLGRQERAPTGSGTMTPSAAHPLTG